MRAPLVPPGSKTETPPSTGRRSTPIIAMESISERERLERRKRMPSKLARATAFWLVRLVPVFLVLLLGWFVLTL